MSEKLTEGNTAGRRLLCYPKRKATSLQAQVIRLLPCNAHGSSVHANELLKSKGHAQDYPIHEKRQTESEEKDERHTHARPEG